MYLNLGSDFLINMNSIVGIFDLDTTTRSEKTKKFLKESESKRVIISVDNDLPKSYVVSTMYGQTRIYLTSLSCSTLKKRLDNTVVREKSRRS